MTSPEDLRLTALSLLGIGVDDMGPRALYLATVGQALKSLDPDLEVGVSGDYANDAEVRLAINFMPYEIWLIDFLGPRGSLRRRRFDISDGASNAHLAPASDMDRLGESNTNPYAIAQLIAFQLGAEYQWILDTPSMHGNVDMERVRTGTAAFRGIVEAVEKAHGRTL